MPSSFRPTRDCQNASQCIFLSFESLLFLRDLPFSSRQDVISSAAGAACKGKGMPLLLARGAHADKSAYKALQLQGTQSVGKSDSAPGVSGAGLPNSEQVQPATGPRRRRRLRFGNRRRLCRNSVGAALRHAHVAPQPAGSQQVAQKVQP